MITPPPFRPPLTGPRREPPPPATVWIIEYDHGNGPCELLGIYTTYERAQRALTKLVAVHRTWPPAYFEIIEWDLD